MKEKKLKATNKELTNPRELAIKELGERAKELIADTVVGVDPDYEVLGSTNVRLMVSVSGTAVKLQ